MKNHQTKKGGFVALMSTILISGIIILMLYTESARSFNGRFNAFDYESKKVSLYLAEACVNEAIKKLSENINYTPVASGECVSLGGTCGAADPQKVCKICTITGAPYGPIIIKTRGLYNKSFTNLSATIMPASGNFSVNSWFEEAQASGSCNLP